MYKRQVHGFVVDASQGTHISGDSVPGRSLAAQVVLKMCIRDRVIAVLPVKIFLWRHVGCFEITRQKQIGGQRNIENLLSARDVYKRQAVSIVISVLLFLHVQSVDKGT